MLILRKKREWIQESMLLKGDENFMFVFSSSYFDQICHLYMCKLYILTLYSFLLNKSCTSHNSIERALF